MMDWRKVIISVAAALIVAESVYADLIPVCQLDAGRGRASRGCDQAEHQGASSYCLFARDFDPADLNSSPIVSLPETEADSGKGRPKQHGLDLMEASGSLEFCLYAFLGLGLCHSAHWVRKSSLGVVPEWYHNGGPFQIGHSLAVSPKILCSAPVYCFVQPDSAVEGSPAPSRAGATASLWRKSQVTPTALAARGPPAPYS